MSGTTGVVTGVAALFLTCFATADRALAQELNCANPTSQVEYTGCAAQAYEAADGDLNLAYSLAVAQAERQDEYITSDQIPSRIMLRDAQRAWITFRDLACDTESTLMRGGTGQNMIFFECMSRLTRERTEHLRIFGEVN